MNFAEALKTADELNAPSAPSTPEAPVENQPNTPAPDANDAPIADPTGQSQTPNTPPPPAEAPKAGEPAAIDYDKYFDEMSGGLIKNLDGFKAVLPKITEYETLKSEKDRLAAEMAQAPKFADDEVRKLNDLKANGATKEQIKQFHAINEYGNITEMPDREALIAKMVMIDGVKPSVAALKVDRDFNLNQSGLNDDEMEILSDDMRIAAVNAKKELEKFKASVSQSTNTPPEELQLQQTAALLEHQNKVRPYAKEVMQSVPNLGVFYLSGKEGDADAVKYEMPIDDAIRGKLAQYVENYFIDGLTDVTPENTRQAMHYARAEYWRENGEQLLKDAYNHGVSITTEKLVNKYENRSGLKPQDEKPLITGGEANETLQYMTDRVNRVGR